MDTFNLLRRDCVLCPTDVPSCPQCPSGEVCSLISRTCGTCPSTTCVKSALAATTTAAASSSSSNGPSVGAIVGGVIGGLAAIAIITYLVWKYWIQKKRLQYREEWTEDPSPEKDFTMQRDARASTHTVGSIASTVLTRASNVIQIAYIPGVTNRSGPTSPDLLVPPVPPIPMALGSQPTTPYEDQHFFMPGDLRDSTYSAMTDRTSYAARSSVASTIYGRNAVLAPVPAQTVIRGKAAMVSVKSGASGETTPPMPSLDFEKYRRAPSPAFSVGSTFLNNANTATQIKPQVVRVVNSTKSKSSLRTDTDTSTASDSITIVVDAPEGPFGDPTPADKEAALEAKREGTPFGDEHATDDDLLR